MKVLAISVALLATLLMVGDVQAATCSEGDTNGDGVVNAIDAGKMFSNWGAEFKPCSEGDIVDSRWIDNEDVGAMFPNWTSDGGPLPSGNAMALYFVDFGNIAVSVTDVVNWYIHSDTNGLTGDDPAGLPVGGGFLGDNDENIGEVDFTPLSYQMNLGDVAAAKLPLGDLTISWNGSLGEALQTAQVFYIYFGDFNFNFFVDENDLTDPVDGWVPRFGVDLDGLDFLNWQRDFGQGIPPSLSAAQAVPEPTTSALALAATLFFAIGRRRARRSTDGNLIPVVF